MDFSSVSLDSSVASFFLSTSRCYRAGPLAVVFTEITVSVSPVFLSAFSRSRVGEGAFVVVFFIDCVLVLLRSVFFYQPGPFSFFSSLWRWPTHKPVRALRSNSSLSLRDFHSNPLTHLFESFEPPTWWPPAAAAEFIRLILKGPRRRPVPWPFISSNITHAHFFCLNKPQS